MTRLAPLAPSFHEKIWGSQELSPWFPNPDRKIGEVWFQSGGPLLIKFLFTTDKLSVQVHPDDDYARVHEKSRGKTEMWHILRAEPDAKVALGFREPLTPERAREAALSGEIEHLLDWVPVKAGDTIYTPAGTVHAIGAGLALCEIQEHSDVTYRLYDYGRPRELHLDRSFEVADLGPYRASAQPRQLGPGRALLVSCAHFVTERIEVNGGLTLEKPAGREESWIALSGEGTLDGAPFAAGQVWPVPAGVSEVALQSAGATFLRTFAPA